MRGALTWANSLIAELFGGYKKFKRRNESLAFLKMNL
jgi:hypothetical protein